MDVTAYESQMAALGIRRGALAEGFADDSVPNQKAPRAGYSGPQGPKVARRPLEDFAHLNPANAANVAGGRRGGYKRHGI